MEMGIGRNRKARVTYGFDEIALVPGRMTINPNEVDITCHLPRKEADPLALKIPILASAMDGVVDVRFAVAMSKLGGLAVLNLEGVQTRYKNPQEVLQKIVDANKADVTALLQRIYQEPVQEDLIAARVRQIKDGGALACRGLGRRRAGSRLHFARCPRAGCSTSHRDRRLRRCARCLFQKNIALRADCYRWRNEQRR